MEYKQIKVDCSVNDLDRVSAIMTAVDPGLLIEDYSDIEENLKYVHADLIEDELLKTDRSRASVSVYISEENSPAESVGYVKERLETLGISAEVSVIGVSDEDWANSWKKYYHPIHIGERLVIVPAWEEYEKREGELTIIMDPGMAFGTGTHETTRLVCAEIENYLKAGDEVLDVGTGSGILAIAASLLGAGSVNAYDIDPTAVRIANENAVINGCDNINVAVSDLLSQVEKRKYKLITANIVADIIIRMSQGLSELADDGAVFIASGILLERKDEVREAMKKTPFAEIDCIDENGWCALVFKKK